MVMMKRFGIVALVLLLTGVAISLSVSGVPCPMGEENSSCMINGTCSENCTCPNKENCTDNCSCLNNSTCAVNGCNYQNCTCPSSGNCAQNCSGSGPCPVKDEKRCSTSSTGCPFRAC